MNHTENQQKNYKNYLENNEKRNHYLPWDKRKNSKAIQEKLKRELKIKAEVNHMEKREIFKTIKEKMILWNEKQNRKIICKPY